MVVFIFAIDLGLLGVCRQFLSVGLQKAVWICPFGE